MLSTKDKKVLKTFDYIIKNKKKDLSPYLSKKLSTMTKLKGGNNLPYNYNEFHNALGIEEEVLEERKQENIENKTGFKRNEIVKYKHEYYRIESFSNIGNNIIVKLYELYSNKDKNEVKINEIKKLVKINEIKKLNNSDKNELIQQKFEYNTGYKRNEVVEYNNQQYRIESFLNGNKVKFYSKSLGKNKYNVNIINYNSIEAEINKIKKLKKDIIMSSSEFLEKSFEDNDKDSNLKYKEVNILLNSIFVDEGESLGGGKSGALIIRFDSGLIFKYSDKAYKKIKHYQDGTSESNRKPLKNYKKTNTQTVYDSGYTYIRAVREIYLCKKFDELYKMNIENARSDSNNNSQKKLEIEGIKKAKEIVSHRASIHEHSNLFKENDAEKINKILKKINKILKKHEENLQKKISKIKLTPEIHYLGFIKNHKIKITDIPKNKNNKEKIKLSLEEIPIEKRKGITMFGKKYTYDTYLPFIVQSTVEGKSLKDYKKSDLEDDNLKIAILYELLLTLSRFKQRVEKNKKHVGCHRDMHPGNIFIEVKKNESSGEINDINARLIDFDLSITNTNNLTVNYQCTRNNLNFKVPFKHTIATTKSWLSNNSTGKYGDDIIDNDNDLYQYMRIYDKLSNIMDDNRHKDILNEIKKSLFQENNNAKKNNLHIYDRKLKFINSMLRMIDSYLRLININVLNKTKNNCNENKIEQIKEGIKNNEVYQYIYKDINKINKLKKIYPFNSDTNKNNFNEINLIIYKEFINYFE